MRQYFIISILALVIFAQLAQSLFGVENMSNNKKADCRTNMTSFLTQMKSRPANKNMTKKTNESYGKCVGIKTGLQ
jgi:uncharacterized membrane protein